MSSSARCAPYWTTLRSCRSCGRSQARSASVSRMRPRRRKPLCRPCRPRLRLPRSRRSRRARAALSGRMRSGHAPSARYGRSFSDPGPGGREGRPAKPGVDSGPLRPQRAAGGAPAGPAGLIPRKKRHSPCRPENSAANRRLRHGSPRGTLSRFPQAAARPGTLPRTPPRAWACRREIPGPNRSRVRAKCVPAPHFPRLRQSLQSACRGTSG